ncbi:MAG: hypothetical protein V1658_01000, partial [Candidatus Micrarchaeota archaeon]
TFNYNVSVTDEDGDGITAYLFIRKGYSGDWSLVSTRSCNSNCNDTMLTIPKSNFACGDISDWQFFWNVSDGNFTYELPPTNFTIEPDDVNLSYVSGSAETIWRNGTQSTTLSMLLFDIDAKSYIGTGLASGRRWVTTNGSSYDVGTAVTSNTGFFNSTYEPTCSYGVGVQSWKMGTVSNSCYKDANSSVFNITLEANLTVSIARPLGVNYTKGTPVPVDFNVIDECSYPVNATTNVLYFAGPDTYVESSGIQDLLNGTYNYSWITSDKIYGYYNLTVQVSKQYYAQSNATQPSALQIVGGPELFLPSLDKGTGGWGETFTFSVQCKQQDGGDFNITLWKKLNNSYGWVEVETQDCQGIDYVDKYFYRTFACGDITPSGASEWKINATNRWGYGSSTLNYSFTIEKDDTDVQMMAGSEININREGTSTGLLKLHIIDTDRGSIAVGSGVNISFSITTDGVNFDSGTANSTDSAGNTSYFFNPTCSYSAGAQKWKGGVLSDTCYKDSSSTNFTVNVTGQLQNYIEVPANGTEYNKSNNILIRFNSTSECSAEGMISEAVPLIQLISPNGTSEACPSVYSEAGASAGYYNCTWNSSSRIQGYWGVQLNSSKTGFFNANTTTYVERFYLRDVTPSAENLSVSQDVGGWSRSYNYSVQIYDPAGDNVSCMLFTSTDGGSTWTLKGANWTIGQGN